jgi:tetratricopeptide (TPR) repeat protein
MLQMLELAKDDAPATRQHKRSPRFLYAIGGAAAILLLVSGYLAADYWIALPADAHAMYVGRQSCADCHQPQAHRFLGSYHNKAMDHATSATVLGDFSGVELEHHGIVSRMFRRDEQFWIHTEGPDGEMADFEVKFVFGVSPLQQYMVEFDRPADAAANELGRLQVLRISWDSENKRWFHLDPPDVKDRVPPGDDLHWTGLSQRWNSMCADCHSTNLQRNFDVATGKYRTTFSEIDVSCEACHGPGSLHVQLANRLSPFWDRVHGKGLASLKTPDNEAEVETCAQCHSRRRIVHGDFRPGGNFFDHYSLEGLHALAYHADGANLDEVYEFGSFTQSRMFHKNIRCSDCHDPHSTQLHFSGNKVCTSCHQHPASKYDTPAHHHHREGSTGASCVECHMPHTTYMELDARRDHGLRIPRPDLSVEHGTPNACTACHLADDKLLSPEKRETFSQYADWLAAAKRGDAETAAALKAIDQWCAEATARWYKPKERKEDKIVPAFAAARTGHPSSQSALAEVALDAELPEIIRATAVAELGQFVRPGSPAERASIAALKDESPQVRAAAIANLQGLEPQELRRHGAPLLNDPVRSVRVEAARTMASLAPAGVLRGREHTAFDAALEEYFNGLAVTDDMAASHLARGVAYQDLGMLDDAERHYRIAMRLEPNTVGPRSNLADLLERRADLARQEAQLAMERRDSAAALALMEPVAGHQAVAEQLRRDELELLQRDAKLAPDNGPLQHRLGLMLYVLDEPQRAREHLVNATELSPHNAHFHFMAALLLEKLGETTPAIEHLRRALELWPDDATYHESLARVEQAQR